MGAGSAPVSDVMNPLLHPPQSTRLSLAEMPKWGRPGEGAGGPRPASQVTLCPLALTLAPEAPAEPG